MIQLYDGGAYLVHGTDVVPEQDVAKLRQLTGKTISKEEGRKGTIAYSILKNHNTSGSMEHLKIKFDAMASHDITFVGIIQTAKASGMEKFPLPYVLTNCHNSLCAVGGTINEDDHVFGLSAAKKYGGIFVPPHVAVIHQYMREKMAGCGRMIIGSDSHTRYGALGTMAVGETEPGRRPARHCHRHRRCRLQERLCQEQGHGIRRSWRRFHDDGLPQQRRRHDDGDDLPVVGMADR